jgi:methyltransferase (TIGR00027 family)
MLEPPRLPDSVGQTALGVARDRAAEAERPDRLFEDPLAAAFVRAGAEAGFAAPAATGENFDVRAQRSAYVAVRTRFFDDALMAAAEAGIRQVVLLAAGLDARAFRLAWPPGTRLFELDQPEMFAFKERVLAEVGAVPRCDRQILGIDLREDWPVALLALGFDTARPSVWLLEGLLMYLSEPQRDGLLARIGELSAAGSQLALEPPGWTVPPELAAEVARGVLDPATIARARALQREAATEMSVADPEAWLRGMGWEPRVYDVAERFHAYGRGPVPVVSAGSRRSLVSASR